MPIIQSYNTRATGAALQLLGGDKLVNAFTQLYNAFDQAEAQGHEDGYYLGRGDVDTERYNDGYRSGYSDGRSDGVDAGAGITAAIEEFNTEDANDKVRPNAMVEGCNLDEILDEMPSSDWSLVKAVAALG